jgi:ECF transporter S component (folate family)
LKPVRLKTKDLVVMAFLMTTEIIFTRFLSIQTPVVRIGFGFLPMAIMGKLYGPFWTGLSYVACDLLGMAIFPRGAFFPGFTFTAFLTGVIYGLFLHNKTLSLGRTFLAALTVGIFCNLFLDTIWLYILTGNAIRVLLPMRLLRVGITIPLQTVLIYVVLNRCAPIFAKLVTLNGKS